jgi:hypothetical protein
MVEGTQGVERIEGMQGVERIVVMSSGEDIGGYGSFACDSLQVVVECCRMRSGDVRPMPVVDYGRMCC